MTNWQHLLYITLGIVLFAAFLSSAVSKGKARKERDFTRSLETLLQPRETIKVICPQKKGRYILTNSRLIWERGGRFHAIALKQIQKVQGTNKEGNRTTVPAKMVTLTVKAETDYLIGNTGPEFETLASQLAEKVKKQNEKKKGKANEKK